MVAMETGKQLKLIHSLFNKHLLSIYCGVKTNAEMGGNQAKEKQLLAFITIGCENSIY